MRCLLRTVCVTVAVVHMSAATLHARCGPFDGVTCNLSVCSDRGYLEHSDLPCVTLGSQIIIDSSGGHGGDDGGSELPLIRYRPWAARTGAWVIVSNPVHEDTDFMGRSPWGGGSAIIRPDGAVLAKLTYEKDTMIVEEIDTDLASRAAAQRRLNHPLAAREVIDAPAHTGLAIPSPTERDHALGIGRVHD